MTPEQQELANKMFAEIQRLTITTDHRRKDQLYCKIKIAKGDVIWMDVYLNKDGDARVKHDLRTLVSLFAPLFDLTVISGDRPEIRIFGHVETIPVRIVIHQYEKEND